MATMRNIAGDLRKELIAYREEDRIIDNYQGKKAVPPSALSSHFPTNGKTD